MIVNKQMKNNYCIRKNKRNNKPIIIAVVGLIVILVAVLLAIFIPGRIRKTDKGVVCKKFGISTKEKWVTRKDKTYYFGKDGYAYIGWNDINDASYHFNDDGVMSKGWFEEKGNKYYLNEKDGKLSKGLCQVKDDNYYFSKDDGAMQTGVIKDNDKIIAYSDEDGKLKTGAFEVEGTLRCFSKTGESVKGWVEVDNNKYYCNEDGTASVGVAQIDNNKYYFDENGVLKTGWSEDLSGNKFYSDETGILATGRQNVDGKLYYFDEDGILKTGWINVNNSERSYAGEDGVLYTGKQTISGIEFTFDDSGILTSQNSGELKMVALTFDDGPSINTDKVLDTLEKFGCKATFFVVGSRVSQYSSQLKRAYDMGCEIGSHTYNHKYLTSLSPEDMQAEIDKTDDAVAQVTGQKTSCIRPPGGFYNDEVKSRIKCPIVMWSIDTQDWKSRNAQSVAQIATSGIQDGDIILMHDLYSSTASAVETIVPALLSQGFQIVTVRELLDAHGGAFDGKVYFSATEIK